jgi:hypothetical protein
MNKQFKILGLAAAICFTGSQSFAQAKKSAWVSLFNGKNLKVARFQQKGRS